MKKNIYKSLYNDENIPGNLMNSPRIKVMAAMINRLDLKGKNILDIGCYDGTLLSLVGNRDNNFFGLDASDWAVEKSQGKKSTFSSIFLTT